MLRQFFIRVIHQIPAVSKTTALWALGLLHLISLFQFPARSLNTQLWLRRLRSLGVNPITYTFAYFETAAVVYIKMPFHQPTSAKPWMYNQHGRFYVGSTNIGVSKREFNRMAKLRQVKLDKAVSCELAIKYWAKRLDFPLFTILVLKTFDLRGPLDNYSLQLLKRVSRRFFHISRDHFPHFQGRVSTFKKQFFHTLRGPFSTFQRVHFHISKAEFPPLKSDFSTL